MCQFWSFRINYSRFIRLNLKKKLSTYFREIWIEFYLLVTPETSEERIKYLDSLSSGFLYAVSSSSTTGNENKEVKMMKFKQISFHQPEKSCNDWFRNSNKTDFEQVTEKSQGGIIGTAFVKILLENKDWKEKAETFIVY